MKAKGREGLNELLRRGDMKKKLVGKYYSSSLDLPIVKSSARIVPSEYAD
jgi:hypothetical protein